MTDGRKLTDTALAAGGIALDLATQNYTGAALQALALTKDFASAAMERRFGRWFKGIAESTVWAPPREVQGLIEAKIKESSEAKESVWSAAKAILDAISDEAAEVIGSITAEYIRDEKGPDPFFRGAVRVLADLSSADLELLRRIVALAVNKDYEGRFVGLTVSKTGLEARGEHGGQALIDETLSGAMREILRLFRLLNANDLGRESPSGQLYADGVATGKTYMERKDLARLALHLGVPAASVSKRL